MTDATFTYDAELGAGYFIRVPSAFMRLPKERYSAEAKVAYCVLLSYAASNETAWPGLLRLCEEVGCSENTLRAALRELLDGGLVSINRRGQGKPNIYTLHKFDAEFRTSKSEVQDPQNLRFKNIKNCASKPSDFEPELRKESNDSNREREALPQTVTDPPSDAPVASLSRAKTRRKPEPVTLSEKHAVAFCDWYEKYPHKVCKQEAVKAWANLSPDAATIAQMAEGLKRWEQSQRWADGIYQNPASWLNARAWEDFPVSAKTVPKNGSAANLPPPAKPTMYREFVIDD